MCVCVCLDQWIAQSLDEIICDLRKIGSLPLSIKVGVVNRAASWTTLPGVRKHLGIFFGSS